MLVLILCSRSSRTKLVSELLLEPESGHKAVGVIVLFEFSSVIVMLSKVLVFFLLQESLDNLDSVVSRPDLFVVFHEFLDVLFWPAGGAGAVHTPSRSLLTFVRDVVEYLHLTHCSIYFQN